jgi:hypothetical protein
VDAVSDASESNSDFYAQFAVRQLRAEKLKGQYVFKTEAALLLLKFLETISL